MVQAKADKTESAPPANDLDKLIHEPARLSIMVHLAVVESADFVFLQRYTGLTHGNLSSHMSKLEQAGYLEVIKEFVERKPRTMLRLTKEGRSAFEQYRKNLDRMLTPRGSTT